MNAAFFVVGFVGAFSVAMAVGCLHGWINHRAEKLEMATAAIREMYDAIGLRWIPDLMFPPPTEPTCADMLAATGDTCQLPIAHVGTHQHGDTAWWGNTRFEITA